MFDYVFVTNSPSFYKVRLWNEIAGHKNIYAFFVYNDDETRNSDFTSVAPEFQYQIIKGTGIGAAIKLVRNFMKIKCHHLVVTGWESLPMLSIPFFSKRKKNIIICESSIYEYNKSFGKDLVKSCFLNRFHKAFPAGSAHKKLLEVLGFRGECRISGGCGLLNYVPQPECSEKEKVKNFLYVGRLVEVKNLEMMIRVFNDLPEKHLTIVGFGPEEMRLKELAKDNIDFTGFVPNSELSQIYRNADVFLLPSRSEPWGLVVEEALNNGLPVIVSNKVGCRDDLVTEETGLVFEHSCEKSLQDAVIRISEPSFYNTLRKNISNLCFQIRAENQINLYI